jgi:hypothetical protein
MRDLYTVEELDEGVSDAFWDADLNALLAFIGQLPDAPRQARGDVRVTLWESPALSVSCFYQPDSGWRRYRPVYRPVWVLFSTDDVSRAIHVWELRREYFHIYDWLDIPPGAEYPEDIG